MTTPKPNDPTKLELLTKKLKSKNMVKHLAKLPPKESANDNMQNSNLKLSKSFSTQINHYKNAKVSPTIKSRLND